MQPKDREKTHDARARLSWGTPEKKRFPRREPRPASASVYAPWPVSPKSIGTFVGSVFVVALAAGCGGSGTLRVTKVAAAAQKPGNVALYLDVRDNGRPVAGLQEKDFKVYEDGKLISPKKGKRALLEAEVTSANFAIIQVDLSGPIADSEHLPDLASTVAHFAQDLNDRQEVAVNAFDGNDEVAPFIGFGSGKEQFKNLADGLRKFRPRTRNSNLYGAVYQGISALEEKLANSPVEDKQATLIVYTDRYEMSHTVGIEQLKEKLKSTSVQVYIVAAGEQINRQELTMLGRSGVFLSNDPKAFKKGFDELNQKLVSLADGRYVLSYCSTKKKGQHKLEVEVETPGGDAKVSHKFNAAGFNPARCTPKTKPVFEEIEAMKADAAVKAKEIAEKEKQKEEEEAAAALAAVKEPTGKESKGGAKSAAAKDAPAKEPAKTKDWAKEMAKASAKEPAKAAPAAAEPKEAPQVDLPPPEKESPPAPAASRTVKQAVDKE
jgi:hypothetical protein